MTGRKIELPVVAAILLIAAFFRLYLLDQLPPGLHYDEAFNAIESERVLTGVERPIFFSNNLGQEPMAMYVTAVVFGVVGPSPWAIRLASALAGILTVAGVYLLARELFQSIAVGALTALVLSILYWHVNFSRLGMEPIFLPLMLTLAWAFFWRGVRRRMSYSNVLGPTAQPRTNYLFDFALGGFFLGGTQYTYKAALAVPLFAAVYLGLEILTDRELIVKCRRGILVFVGVAVLAFAPLGLYFVAHSGEFLERPSAVTSSSSDGTVLLDNAVRVAGMFFIQGDENPRSNLPGRPALDPVLAAGFVVGLVVSLKRIRQREAKFILTWLFVMVMPSVLTDYAPHFGRSIGATPVLALVCAQGGGWLGALRLQRRVLVAVACISLAASGYLTFHDYFQVWGARTGLYDSFDVGYWSLASGLRERPPNEVIYISPVDQEYFTLQFALAGREARSFDGRRALVFPPPGASASYGIVTREDTRSVDRLKKIFPQAGLATLLVDYVGKPYASILRADGPPRLTPQHGVNARLDDRVQLIGYDLDRSNNTLTVTLYWRSIAETRVDYSVFIHLIGEANPVTRSPVWAQDDARPGHGSYPTTRWQAGEVILDDYVLAVPRDLPKGAYQIEVGMYTLESGARAQVTDTYGAPVENNCVMLMACSQNDSGFTCESLSKSSANGS